MGCRCDPPLHPAPPRLYHGRLPSEDVDGFSPWIVAPVERPQILPAPITSIYPGMLLRVRSEVL